MEITVPPTRGGAAPLANAEPSLTSTDTENFAKFINDLDYIYRKGNIASGYLESDFQALARQFGGRRHIIDRRSSATPEAETSIDPLFLGAMQFVASHTRDTHFLSDSLATYLHVPPEFRTHFTDQQIGVQLVSAGLQHLDPDRLRASQSTNKLQSGLHAVSRYLGEAVTDLSELFLRNDTLLSHLLESVGNHIFDVGSTLTADGKRDEEIYFYRFHTNMTTINEKDHTGALGTTYLQVLAEWFKKHGFQVAANPENTTFIFTSTDSKVRTAMAQFSREIKSIMLHKPGVPADLFDNLQPEAHVARKTLRIRELLKYAIQSKEDFDLFSEVIFYRKLDDKIAEIKSLGNYESILSLFRKKDPIAFKAIQQSKNYQLQKSLEALVVQALLRFLKELAAETSYFEKETPPQQKQTLYTEEMLPGAKNRAGQTKYQAYLDRAAGFVGPAVFDAAKYFDELRHADLGVELEDTMFGMREGHDLPPKIQALLRLVPRRNRYLGYLSHQRLGSQGGTLEVLNNALSALVYASDEAALAGALTLVGQQASDFATLFTRIHQVAVTHPRNPTLIQPGTVFKLATRGESVGADFAAERIALAGNTLAAVMEIDSFKAFNDANPTGRFDDPHYHRVLAQILLAAQQMNMRQPIVNPANGDQIDISFHDKDQDGQDIDAVEFCKKIQALVKEHFAEMPFQDYKKVSFLHLPLRVDEQLATELSKDEFWSAIFKEQQLQAMPFVVGLENNKADKILTVAYPMKMDIDIPSAVSGLINSLKKVLTKREISASALALQGIPLFKDHRMKMWQPSEGGEGLVYAHKALPGYEPFIRSLTVSLTLGEHAPLIDTTTVTQYREQVAHLGRRLGSLKAEAKEVFSDERIPPIQPTDPSSPKIEISTASRVESLTANDSGPLGEQNLLDPLGFNAAYYVPNLAMGASAANTNVMRMPIGLGR